ncbi:uncharacterized protein L3040_006957 [Drepanopeziza brunnea f. sp. 'multigermtubi']|uniref:uncharacterized protein n=1 Tax=Drepanopeziza brunnea f. sp. 'multigermtubi' TaxID=698441 RepID=UPI0023A33E09|nr:hypothetical protein L3040_006957 [Drepanopeziza brunnea f. sp. 'multigermtubi']
MISGAQLYSSTEPHATVPVLHYISFPQPRRVHRAPPSLQMRMQMQIKESVREHCPSENWLDRLRDAWFWPYRQSETGETCSLQLSKR